MPRRAPKPQPPRRKLYFALGSLVVLVIIAIGWGLLNGTRPGSDTPDREASALSLSRHLYSETADPDADIASALAQAARDHKRVIVDFGGDWCADCQVLDIYLHQSPNAQLLAQNYLLVHVWIGHMDAHLDVPARYGIPVEKGVPALAVLDPAEGLVYAQRSDEFGRMREMNPATVTEFLEKWKS